MSTNEQSREYQMPAVKPGTPVKWYPSARDLNSYHPGFVTAVGHGSVAVNVMEKGIYNFRLLHYARHVSDPRANDTKIHDDGAWDFTDDHYRVEALEKQVAALAKEVVALKSAANKK